MHYESYSLVYQRTRNYGNYVTCGNGFTAAIKTDGTLWTWGANDQGQLGINVAGATTNRTTPVTTFLGGTNELKGFPKGGIIQQ